MTCEHCGRNDHQAIAHRDPEAAFAAGEDAEARGDISLAMAWFVIAKNLAKRQYRELRGLRG